MKNAFLKTLIVAAMLATASIAFTQDTGGQPVQPGGRGQGQRGQGQGQGRQGQRMGMQQQGFTNPLAGSGYQLLNRQDVQTDLVMTEEQKTAVQKLGEKFAKTLRDQMVGGGTAGPGQRMDPSQRQAMIEKADAAVAPEIKKILDEKQLDRFRQIRIQLAGLRAVLATEIQNALGMDGQQKTNINVLARNATNEQAAMRQQVVNGQIAREDFATKNQAISEKFDKDLAAAVTDAQKAALKEMGGAEFKQQARGEGRPGTGSGRPGGRPGGAAQPQ